VHSAASRVVATSSAVVPKRSKEGHAMNCQQEQIREARFSERIALQCSLVFANGRQVGEGRVLDMSVPGCLVESSVPVKVGDYLQLRLCLPDYQPSLFVSLAAVRWAQGLRFGLELIGMNEMDRVRLNRFVALQGDLWARVPD